MEQRMAVGIILVGGFPKPIGGVTTFVRRLAATDKKIEEVIDLYPNKGKEIPPAFKGRYKQCGNRIAGYVYMAAKMITWQNKYIHFNFSNFKALIFFIILPKLNSKWILMLHHGELEVQFPDFLAKHLLRKFDYIFCMNDRQRNVYLAYLDHPEKLISTNSYIKSIEGSPDATFQKDIDRFFSMKPTLIASGYPSLVYNFDWCIRFVNEREDYQLALFIYGEGTEKVKLQTQFVDHPKVKIYWNQSENNFNYALSKSYLYLRPNTRDSFGIAVADAVNFGVPVLASDVCQRFKGAETFTITTYDSFERALIHSLKHIGTKMGQESSTFVPFSYNLIAEMTQSE